MESLIGNRLISNQVNIFSFGRAPKIFPKKSDLPCREALLRQHQCLAPGGVAKLAACAAGRAPFAGAGSVKHGDSNGF